MGAPRGSASGDNRGVAEPKAAFGISTSHVGKAPDLTHAIKSHLYR